MRSSAFLLLTLSAFAQAPEQEPTTAKEWLNRGVQRFKSANYSEAVAAFERVVQLDPGLVTGHLYLATANFSQFRPGDDSAANLDFARRTESALNSALAIDSRNMVALKTMASLKFSEAQGVKVPAQKISALDEAERWYRRILEVDNRDKEALYSIGVIAWSKAYPENQQARSSIGMRREDPGPIRDPNMRLEFRNRTGRTVEEGIASLQKALEIDPQYDDAMAYLNLLYRQVADGVDTQEEYTRKIMDADLWVQRALEAKRAKASPLVPPNRNIVPAPPPPPGAGPQPVPGQIRVGGMVMAQKLIQKIDPIYPPMAKQARIQGVVRFNAAIGHGGDIVNLALVSGHPLLVPNATEAVRQWKYQPTLLNGQPVEVVTQIDVNFTLSE